MAISDNQGAARISIPDLYAQAVSNGGLVADPAQLECAKKLERLAVGILQPPSREPQQLWSLQRPANIMGRGLYLVGEVGRGKTMLMDLFYVSLPLHQKRRVHFHAFMQDIIKALNSPELRRRRVKDPLAALAQRIAAHNRVLCFDEFQLNDMSDAIVNLRIIELLIKAGVVLVATSNTGPTDLLGHNRIGQASIQSFIEMMKQNFEIVHLDASRDYRQNRATSKDTWRVPPDKESDALFSRIFLEVTGHNPIPASIAIGSRQFAVTRSGDNIARFSFEELCARLTGTAEFLAIAARYPVIIIDDIPQLSPDKYDEAMRFIRLIDVLYEQGTWLYASAEVWPKDIYPEGENALAFRRTISRLEEMRSASWQSRPRSSG